MSGTQEVNKNYYDDLYKRKNLFIQLIHPLISFDQQSKAKPNYRFISNLFKNAGEDLKYLDYGFGHGSLLLKIPQKLNLYGCDISVQAVDNFPRVAKIFGKKVQTFTPMQIDEMIKDNELDIISLSHVLEHVNDDYGLLKDLTKKLKLGGHVLINLPINELVEDPKHVRSYDRAKVEKLLKECGLNPVKITEQERVSNFFIYHELIKTYPKFVLPFFKILRAMFAILPKGLYHWFDRQLKDRFENSQILALGTKVD